MKFKWKRNNKNTQKNKVLFKKVKLLIKVLDKHENKIGVTTTADYINEILRTLIRIN